jgi:hypothetical protein
MNDKNKFKLMKRKIKLLMILGIMFTFLFTSTQIQAQIYSTNLVSNDIGFVKMYLTIEIGDSTFTAYSRKGATKEIMGGGAAMLMKTFAGIKDGSIIRINGTVKDSNNIKILDGIFISPMGNYYFNGELENNSFSAYLSNANREKRGSLDGSLTTSTKTMENYEEITTKALTISEKEIFNPNFPKNRKWEKFKKKLSKASENINDDLEMVFSFFYYARKLPISHLALVKKNNNPTHNASEMIAENLNFKELSKETALLTINSFGGSAEEMYQVFDEKIIPKNYSNLIVDLRDNGGGSIEAGLAFASKLVNKESFEGILLTRKYFDKNDKIPSLDNYSNFPHFEKANFDLLVQGLHDYDGICIKVTPNKSVFKGNVFILTSKYTGSTCEPIVYGLKQSNRATIIGENTAGKMLSSEPFEVQNDFQIYVPIADYYTNDGVRLDQKGVAPNYKTKYDKALEYTLNQIIK